jgi:hypothetical protein
MNRREFGLSVVALLAGSACNSVPPLANTHGTPESLAAAVLDALERRDRATLNALALNEQEFRDHVWPDLPAARPDRNLPFSYVWGDLHQKSNLALAATLVQLGGTSSVLSRVTFSGTTDYAHSRVHRDATFHVHEQSGEERAIHVCGSMLEKDGGWKVFSYVVD